MSSVIKIEKGFCACGRPLHYPNEKTRKIVAELVELCGEFVNVQYGQRTWRFQRHFIALHGLKGWEVPQIAAEFGFEEVL